MLGLLVTSISGFYGRDYRTGGETDIGYGIPFFWHGEQESAHSNSQTGWFFWQNFVYDVAAWSILFGILALAFSNRRQGKRPQQR
jgi:4-amino-4-deoxy-L-arabinose transferase-like glycosyltransferase